MATPTAATASLPAVVVVRGDRAGSQGRGGFQREGRGSFTPRGRGGNVAAKGRPSQPQAA